MILLNVTTRAVIRFPMTTASNASFHDRPMAIKELPILQFETAKASEIQYVTTGSRVSLISKKSIVAAFYIQL